MGVLATVNGLGDFIASVTVGSLFLLGPPYAYGTASAVMFLGALLLISRTGHVEPSPPSAN
jgi:hypothetical protein